MLKGIPLFRIGMYFLLGILTDNWLELPAVFSISLLFLVLSSYALNNYFRKGSNRNDILFRSLLLSGVIFLCGTGLNATVSSFRKKVEAPSEGIQFILLKEKKNHSKNTTSFIASSFCWDGRSWHKPIKVFVSINNDLSVRESSLLASSVTPQRIKGNNVPGAFDFARFAAMQDICHSVYLNRKNTTILSNGSAFKSRYLLDTLRNNILEMIRHHVQDPRDAGLAEALLIGYRKNMDPAMTKTYLDTGVVHVIAISGMHLGLIFGLINLIIAKLFGKNGSRWAGLTISLPILWSFALLTGSSASVLRSVIMFSFLIVANSFKRRNRGMNSLFGSAVILLVYDPDLIRDIGFQLSYAAVLSIMLFNKPIENWIYIKNPLLKLFWKLIAMTLAAQVLTSGWVIAHFHRFPTLFLFTNLVAVPLSSLLLLLEICLIIVSQSEILSRITVLGIKWGMKWMNGYISAMAKIPFGMINDIQTSAITALAGTFLLGLLIFALTKPSRFLWRLTTVVFFTYSAANLSFYFITSNLKQTIIISIKNESAIIHQHGRFATFMIPEKWSHGKSDFELLRKICLANNIHQVSWRSIPSKPMLVTDRHHFVMLHTLQDLPEEQMKKWIKNELIVVLDGTMKMWKIKQLQKATQGLHLRFHSLRDEGPIAITCHLDCPNR